MATTTRSPSPSPSRPRTPDNIIARKSSGHIPSASEPHQRSAGCKAAASSRASFEHKENERDPNSSASKAPAARARSPAAAMSPSSAKGAKNFMAPTISAASKAVAASPRRRILAEKNGAAAVVVRSSVTSLPDYSPAPDEVLAKRELCFGPRSPQDSSEKAEPGIKNRRHSDVLSRFPISPATVAPFDANPSIPPYDPHTNYLSPRPRFLHYRPNTRIEQYLHDEGGSTDAEEGKRLEDSFTSESCEDMLGENEEEQSSTPQKHCEESSFSEVDVTGEDKSRSPVPESPSYPKSSGKGRSFSSYKIASLLLVLFIVCALGSFRGCPIMSSSMLRTLAIVPAVDDLHIRDYLAASALNLKELAIRLGPWSLNPFSYYTTVTTLPREEFGPIFLANLTASNLEQIVDIDYSYGGTMLSNGQITQGGEMEQIFEGDIKEESVEEHDVDVSGDELEFGTVYEDEKSGMDVAQSLEENDIVVEADTTGSVLHDELQEDSLLESKSENKVEEADAQEMDRQGIDGIEPEKNFEDIPHDVVTEHEAVGSQDESSSPSSASQMQSSGFEDSPMASDAVGSQDESSSPSSASQMQSSGFEDSPVVSDDEHEISSNLKSQEFSIYETDGKHSMKLAAGLFSVVLLLVACCVFLLMKPKQSPMVDKLEIRPAKEAISKSVSGSSDNYGHARGSPYQNTPVDMMVSDSGPSEFSSSLQHSTSVGRRRTNRKDKEEETESHERRLRRDSAVSSSSISYGSFTTYERLSAKKGSKDEEVMTPVRRSSRIRNQIVSP